MIAPKKDLAPGSKPTPDDQGNLDVCTRFAICKAIIFGFMMKIFVPGKEIDIDQACMTLVLLNEHKDGEGKWPDKFNNKKYQLLDSKRRYWETHVSVQEVQNLHDFISDIGKVSQVNTYVLVYPLDSRIPNGAKHCIFIEGYNPVSREVLCINSDQNDPTPRISINDPGLIFYKVSCTATEMTPGATLPAPVTSTTSSSSTSIAEIISRFVNVVFTLLTVFCLLFTFQSFIIM